MMKKTLLYLLFALMACTTSVWAGTTTLTTYYPVPTGSFNKLKLSTSVAPVEASVAYCTASGQLYVDQNSQVVYYCTGANASTPYPQAAQPPSSATMLADGSGTIHVFNGNLNGNALVDTIYPQGCYNLYCTCGGSQGACPCTPQSSCPAGYGYQSGLSNININAGPLNGVSYDQVQISASTYMDSYVCCSN